MPTSSIKKNFVINSKKSAIELANRLLEVENSVVPTLKRPRISRLVGMDGVACFIDQKNILWE